MGNSSIHSILAQALKRKLSDKASQRSAEAIQATALADTVGTPAAHLTAAALHARAARAHEKCGGDTDAGS